MKKYFLPLLILFLSLACAAVDNKTLSGKIAEGNKAYKNGNFQEAEQKYADAQVDSPDSPEANYDAGLACYRLEKYDEAISAFQRAANAASPALEAKCHYNIGNCLFRQGKLKESLESYKRANELDRDDEDTKANIEYVTRLMKELASQQKDEQEKDPLQKLLRELEALIRAQNVTLIKTVKGLEKQMDNDPMFSQSLLTNQYQHSEKAGQLIVGFQALFTNLPPERLQSTGEAPIQQGLEQTPENEALVALYQTIANLNQGLSQCVKDGIPQTDVFQSLSNRFQEARTTAVGLVSENVSPTVNDMAGRFAEVFNNFYDLTTDLSILDAPALKECFEKYGNICQDLVKELRSRSGKKDESEDGEEKEEAAPMASAKTLAMKITNAVEFLRLGEAASKKAEKMLKDLITDAPTNQFVALDNFIKARKEFEDDDQKNDEKQQQNQQQQQNDNQNQEQDQEQQDQQDQQQNEDQNNQQDQQGQQQNQQDQNDQHQNQQQQQEQSGEMTKEQAEQMLRAFEEDNSDSEKNRRKMPVNIVPVDKNW